MISNISEKITQRWIQKNIIPQEDYELYHYGLFVILSDALLFTFTLSLGIILKIAFPSIAFFVSFFVIRRFAGGFHAKTELHCQLISLSFLFLSIAAIKCLTVYIDSKYILLIGAISAALLFYLSPSDTPQKQLSKSERKMFRRYTGYVSVAFLAVVCALLYFNVRVFAIAIVCALVLEAVLVAFGRALNHRLADEQ